MFWRKKKITFRDVVTTIVLGDSVGSFELPIYININVAKVMAVESMKFGIAVGAQFPMKVLPIIRQVERGNAENVYAQIKKSLQSWVDLNAGTDIVVESTAPIAQTMAFFEDNSIKSITRHDELIRWTEGTLNSGLLMGNLYPAIYLKALEASINNENGIWQQVKEYAPADVASKPVPTYQAFLSDVKEMVARYEKDQGVLS